ncbi:unnamed protein product [Ectocarpus sp. 12 AP-2014]
MSISTAEFCGTEDEEVELVFSLKEIKVRMLVGMALLHFSETTEAQTLEMLFREGGDPLLFQSHSKAFAAELIMATMEPKVIRKEPPPPTAVAAGGAKREPGTAAGSGGGGTRVRAARARSRMRGGGKGTLGIETAAGGGAGELARTRRPRGRRLRTIRVSTTILSGNKDLQRPARATPMVRHLLRDAAAVFMTGLTATKANSSSVWTAGRTKTTRAAAATAAARLPRRRL